MIPKEEVLRELNEYSLLLIKLYEGCPNGCQSVTIDCLDECPLYIKGRIGEGCQAIRKIREAIPDLKQRRKDLGL